jgi:hypothetical protein
MSGLLSWLNWSPHLKSQVLRFLRTSGLALVAILAADGWHVNASNLWAILVGAAETGLRELIPVAPLPFVTSQPARPTETAPPKE